MYALFDLRGSGSGSQIYVQKYVGGTFTNVYNEIISTSGWDNDWHTVRVSRDQNNQFKVYLDGALKTTFTDNTLTASSHIEAFVDYGSGVKQGDFDDLRVRKYSSTEPSATTGSETVKSSGNEASLPFWLESDRSAWVKLPSVPAGASSINMYYGNSSAVSASNGTATFLFFDDFNRADGDGNVDNSVLAEGCYGWGGGCGTVSISGNTLYETVGAAAENGIRTVSPLILNEVAFDGKMNWIGSYDNPDFQMKFSSSNVWATAHDSSPQVLGGYNPITVAITGSSAVSAAAFYNAGWFDYSIRFPNATHNQLVITRPGVNIGIGGLHGYNIANPAYFYIHVRDIGTLYLDNFRVRKYVSSEPSASGGVEQQADTTPPSVLVQSPNASVTYFSASVPLNFTASDASGITECKYELNGLNSTLAGCANATINALSGANSLKVWAYDGSNWGSASVLFNVSLDTIPPSVSISSPLSQSYSSASVPVNFIASDVSGVSSCVVRLNGTVNSSSCSNYSLVLGNGAYTLNISANDTFGNANSSAVSFTVNLTVSVSNSTTTNSNGIGNVSLSGIPPGATRIVYSVGSNSFTKSFKVSSGVSSVRLSARATLQGTPASGKALSFEIS